MTVGIERTDDLDTCLALRRAVFIQEQGVSEVEEVDGSAQHLLAYANGTPVEMARHLFMENTIKIGRACVVESARGVGLSADLIRAALGVGRSEPGFIGAQLGTQVDALGFYEKLGFAAHGPPYDDAGIDHRDMERSL